MEKYGLKKNILFRSTIKLYGYTIHGSKYDCKYGWDITTIYREIISIVEMYNPDDVITSVNNICKYYNFNLDSFCNHPNFLNIFNSVSIFCSYFLQFLVGGEFIVRILAHFLEAYSVDCGDLPLDIGFKNLEYYMNVKKLALQESNIKYDRLNKIIRATNNFYIRTVGYGESEFAHYIRNNIHLIVDILSFTHLVVIQPSLYKHIYICFYSHKGQKCLISHPLITNTIYSVPTHDNYDSSAPAADLFPLL